MNIKFGIREKIGLGYVLLIILLVLTGLYVFSGFRSSSKIDSLIADVFLPSIKAKSNLVKMVENTPKLANSWLFTSNLKDRDKLKLLIDKDYPELKVQLLDLFSKLENTENLEKLNEIFALMDQSMESSSQLLLTMVSTNDFENDIKVEESLILLEDKIKPTILKIEEKIESLADFESETQSLLAKKHKSQRLSEYILLFGILIGIIVAVVFSYFNIYRIILPIKSLKLNVLKIGRGEFSDLETVKLSSDEIGEMVSSVNILIEGLSRTAEFAKEIGHGNLDKELHLLGENDMLGNALLEMRDSLVKAKDEEKNRKLDDEKRRWANEGHALFAETLRQNNENIENLATQVIIDLVNYLKANQGGLFILNDEDKNNVHFNLLSTYAYDRRKYLDKTIQIGEGLVGACAIEKKTIFMTDIPDNYMKITSGLGGSSPRCLLIVPLKLENNVFGIIEIASFNVFEKHEIEFVEKLAESIASTFSSVRINIRTTKLLEQSQIQREKMAAQEEEMRQNLEELTATQEEMIRKENDLTGIIQQLKDELKNTKK